MSVARTTSRKHKAQATPTPASARRASGSERATTAKESDTKARGVASQTQRSPYFGEDAIALDFTRRHFKNKRYVGEEGRWYAWTGKVWKRDVTLDEHNKARLVCRERAIEAEGWGINAKFVHSLASERTVSAVVRMARSDRRHAWSVAKWDTDSWRLNTPTGIVDLRTGKLLPHDRNANFTKMTAVGPSRRRPRLWLRFLHRIFAGSREMTSYIQRLLGYSLTGSIREHALPFGWGLGANGKTTFVNTVSGVMGDFATVAPMETFTESQGERHPTDLAMLQGARLVTAQETEEGRHWAESRIKALTGGDPITARFMRQDFFTYNPTFKILIAGNHRPRLHHVDEAMARRIHMVPFAVVIPKKERDPDLPDKLKEEWPEILGWMIEGAVKWHKEGLRPPKAVLAATSEYLEEEDTVGRWLNECCREDARVQTPVADLFRRWNEWAEENGEAPLSKKSFSQSLMGKGFARGLSRGQRTLKGLRLSRKPRFRA